MADSEQKAAQQRAPMAEPATRPSSHLTQFKAELANMSYQQQVAAIQPDLPIQFLGQVQMAGGTATGFIPGTVAGVTSTTTVSPFVLTTADPKTFTGTYGKFNSNWTAVMTRIRGLCSDATKYDPALVDTDITKLGGKKDNWYDRWGRAALSGDAAAARTEFLAILTEMKTVVPGDAPDAGGGHLYTGYAGGRGRTAAEDSATEQRAATGVKHTTLEETVTGHMFDNITGDPPDHIQWGNVVEQWWRTVSPDFASTFTGSVACHVNVGVPYFVKKYFHRDLYGKSAADARALVASGSLDRARKLDPTTVFAVEELNKIAEIMGQSPTSVITNVEFKLKVEVASGTFVEQSVNVAPAPGMTAAQLLQAVDAKIATMATNAHLDTMAVGLTTTPP